MCFPSPSIPAQPKPQQPGKAPVLRSGQTAQRSKPMSGRAGTILTGDATTPSAPTAKKTLLGA